MRDDRTDWPGGGGVDEPMFYSYAYPAPDGFSGRRVAPSTARFDEDLDEFVLSYEAMRTSANPEGDVMAFLQTTYEATAEAADWDREALECKFGSPAVPRTVHRRARNGARRYVKQALNLGRHDDP